MDIKNSISKAIWRNITLAIEYEGGLNRSRQQLPGAEPNLERDGFPLDIFSKENWGEMPEMEKLAAKWLEDSIESSSDYLDRDGEIECGIDVLAWYNSFSNDPNTAGIYITERGIALYASRILKMLTQRPDGAPADACRVSIAGAIALLMSHEMYHHRVESYCLSLSSILKRAVYRPYVTTIYEPKVTPVLQDDCLEEAVSSAFEYLHVSDAIYDQLDLSSEDIADVRKSILTGYDKRPPSYKNGKLYTTPSKFKRANLSLSVSCASSREPEPPIENIPVPVIKKGFAERILLENWTYVPDISDGLGVMAFCIPTKQLKTYLRSQGFEMQSGRGKGSHEIWQSAGKPFITLPNRKEQLPRVSKSIAMALGVDSIESLRKIVLSN